MKLNDEEKKAIEKINEKMEFRKNCMKSYEEDKCYTSFYYELKSEVEMYKTLLNLIEKLKKSISNERKLAEAQITYDMDEMWKSKIQDKIDEYTNLLMSCNRFSDVDRIKAINERILILKELLEEE